MYPVIDGVPILINEARSIFNVEDLAKRGETFFRSRSALAQMLSAIAPTMSLNIAARRNYRLLAQLLCEAAPKPRLLVLGGSIAGAGIDELAKRDIEIVDTDVAWGPRTRLIADAHDIPFIAETFDGVIAQAVLEHVVDPFRCVTEIHRVLRPGGLVYAETPFMQQVHGGRYDFHRFTHLGHRRLFRDFGEVDSGVAAGPGMALSWSYTYFLMSFATAAWVRSSLRAFGRITSFFLKYADLYLQSRPGALDAASAYYFLGRKEQSPISDRDLVEGYRGAMR